MGKNNKKYTYNEVNKIFKKLGYQLLDKEYKNVNIKLNFKDDKGYLYFSRLCELLKNHLPYKISKSNPYTIQNIKLWCKLNNKPFELISEIYKGNKEKLKWKCLKKDCGEEFESSWNEIVENHGCSYCVGQKVGISNCLAIKNPELTKEWHSTKNGDLTPYNVTSNSHIYVWWQCSKNSKHVWFSSILNRNNGDCCPYCSGRLPSEDYNLLVDNPVLCEEWNYEKNNKRPEEYCPNSGEYIWWKCKKCGYEWKTRVVDRNSGCHGCPECNRLLNGENHWNWKGGITELSDYIRRRIKQWKFDSLKSTNFKCLITGFNNQYLVVHHLYSFSKILEETLINLNIKPKGNISNYSQEELNLIERECLNLHYKIGLGIPIISPLHKIFHLIKGKLLIDNGEFEDFVNRYYNFEFDRLLESKYKYINILKTVS